MSIKRNEFLKHLNDHNCFLSKYASKHDIFQNEITKKKTTIPRHPQLDKRLCELICKQLEIAKP